MISDIDTSIVIVTHASTRHTRSPHPDPPFSFYGTVYRVVTLLPCGCTLNHLELTQVLLYW
eukprot:1277949-Prymnesium_polylepis.1